MPRPSTSRIGSPQRRLQALTLLELLAVLVILSVVATLAVHSLQPRVENARFEQARALLREIDAATAGPPRGQQADGTPLIQGFIADVGRPPMQSPTPATAGGGLDELWNPQSKLALSFPFQFRAGPNQPVDYSDIRLPCGWRNPYLILSAGQREVLDPWARPLQVQTDARGTIVAIECLVPPPLDEPLRLDFASGIVSVAGTIGTSEPNPPTIDVVLLAPQPEQSTSVLSVINDEDPNPNAFRFSSVPIGLRAICVRAGGQRVVKYVQIPRGGLTLTISLATTAATQP